LAAANEAIAASAAELAAAKQAQAELADKYNTLAQQQQRNAQALLVVTATAVPPAPAVTATPAYASMDALLAAIQAANPAAVLIQAPDTVMYANTVAYEFVFDMGTLYVTATDGSILYDGIAANARAVANARDQQRPPRDHGGRHHRDRDRDNDDDSEDGDDN
jgi:hypothetical protein